MSRLQFHWVKRGEQRRKGIALAGDRNTEGMIFELSLEELEEVDRRVGFLETSEWLVKGHAAFRKGLKVGCDWRMS